VTGALPADDLDAFYASKVLAKPSTLVPAPEVPALSIGKAQAPTPADDFDAFYKQKAAGNAGIAAAGARDANPDKFALADQIGREMGLPATVVERNLPEMEAKKRQSDLVKVLKDNPKLAKWYSQFDNARSVSPEDAANLGMLEQLSNAWDRGMLGLRQQGGGLALGADARALQNITAIEGRLARGEAPENIPDIDDTYGVRFMTPDERGALRAQVQRSTGQRVLDVAGREIERNRINIDPTVQKALGAETWGEFWTHFTEKPLTFIATVGVESLPQMGPTIVAGAIGTLAGGPAGGAALAGATSYGLDYAAVTVDALREEGVDVTNPLALRKAVNDPELMARVGAKAASHATAVGTFDALSGGLASKTLAPKAITSTLGREVTSMAVQAPLQGALGASGEVVGTVLAGDEVKAGEVAAEFFGEFIGAPAEVASIAGAQGLRGVREVTEQRAAAATAQRNQDIFKALDSSAAGLKMREALPERTREAVNQILAGGPVDTIYVPAQKVNELFQSLGLGDQYDDPLDWFDSISPGLGREYTEALDLGADVAIPLPDYYTKIAGTKANGVLVEHLRFHPGEMTASEAKALEGDADALFAEALKEAQSAEAQAKLEAGPTDFVFEDVQRRAQDAGIAPDQARQYAALWRAFFRIAGEKYKIDPKALYEKYGVQVRRQIPQGVIETPVDQMDLLIDDLRSSKAPRQKDLVGSSLLEWISRRGGVLEDAGELATMDAQLWHKGKRGRRMLVRDPAKPKQPGEDFSLDETARAAWEAGYFPELGDQRPDVNTLLEAIRAELSGKARYAERNVDAAGVERQQMIKDLDEALYTLGIDPATAPNEVIKEALRRAGSDAKADEALFQSAAPVATLTGEEIIAADASAEEIRKAARGWYRANLAGTTVTSPDLGEIAFVARGLKKAVNASADTLKLRLFPALIAIMEQGQLVDTVPNNDPTGFPHILRYHFIEASVAVGSETVRVRVNVEERTNGKIYYNHTMPERRELFQGGAQVQGPSRPGVPSPGERRGTDGAFRTEVIGPGPSGESLTNAGDDVNLTIVRPVIREFEQRRPDTKRGSIQLSPGSTIINLFEQADLSTFLHESGHFFLEVTRDLALRPDAPVEAKADWETLKRELGIPDDGPIPVAAHEKFATGFEAHLMEGKAPSAELAGAFQRFRAWLSYVYKTIQRLGGPVSEPVAQVMNRMLASADEIAQAEATYRYDPAFKTADAAGLTEAEFRAYMATAQRATDNATRELEKKLMLEVRREQEAQWKARRAEIRAEVEAEMQARPVYRALAFLRGKDLDGAVPVAAMRLDREGVVAVIGEAGLKRLPKSVPPVYALSGGVDPALVGDMFGFGSGAEMLEALMAVQPLASAVEAETAARMHAEFGDLMTDRAGLAEAAEAAVHSDERALFLATELRALARKSGNNGRAVPAQAARAIAREVIGRTKTGEIRIAVYARAEQRAAREAEKAILEGDMAAATEAKRKQLLNHMLVVEARKAADTVEAAVKYLSKFRKRRPTGGIDAEYYAQIRELLERHDLRPVSGPRLERRESLLAFVTAQQALGNPITVPDHLIDEAKRQHIKQMTLGEVEGLRDTVRQIAHLGKLKKTLRTAKDKRDFEAGRNAVVDRINDQGPGRPESPNRNPQSWERFTSWVRGIDAGLLKLETIIEWLDGGPTGPLHDYVWQPLVGAQGREMDLQVKVAGELEKAFRRLPKEQRNRLKDKVLVPELGGKTYRRDELIAVALNTGNEGNLTKMLEGEAKRGGAWDKDSVFRALFRLLSKEEWDLVQEIWNTIDQFWPETAALEKRLTGVEPVKVERQPVTTPWGVLPGGYYPVVYDPKLDPGAERYQDQAAAGLFEDFITRPTTASGHTKERTTVAKPILLDLDVLVRHVNQVIHRISHQEAIMQAHRLLTDAKVRGSIESQMSPEVYRQFVPWLQAIANDRHQDVGLRSWDQLANGIRANATMMGLGYRISTIIAQVTGFSNVAEVVGLGWMLKGIAMTYGNPLKTAEAYRFARGKSAELRHRASTMDRDIRDSLRGLTGQRGLASQVKRFAFAGIGLLDGFVSTAAWMAGYHKQLKLDPNDDAAAIAAGDRVIRASQGAGGTKDLAAIQRHPGLWKLLTMFYSFFSVLYNRQRDLGRATVKAVKSGSVAEFPALLARGFFLVVVPSVLGDLLVGKGPDEDDDEGWAEWMAKKMIAYPFMSLPVARDVIGGMTSGFGYQFTPAARGIDTIAKLLDDIRKAFDPDEEVDGVKATKHAVETAGYLFGLPLGQVTTTFSQVWEGLEDGDLAFRDLFLSKAR
jgi:hypothetical protein